MDGRATFRAAVARLDRGRRHEVVAEAGITLDDVDLFVYHQANARILSAVGERLGLPPGAGRRLDRHLRQHLGRERPDRPRRGAARGPHRRRLDRLARRLRRRAHLGRRPGRVGNGAGELMAVRAGTAKTCGSRPKPAGTPPSPAGRTAVRWSPAPRAGSAPRSRPSSRAPAGRWRSTTAPIATAPSEVAAEVRDAGGDRRSRSAPTSPSRAPPRRCSRRPRSELGKVLVLGQQRRPDRRRALDAPLATRIGTGSWRPT